MQFQIKKIDFIFGKALGRSNVGINVRDGWHTLKIEKEWKADLRKIN